MIFRDLSIGEFNLVEQSIRIDFGVILSKAINKNNLIISAKRKEVFFIGDDAKKTLMLMEKEPYSAGISFGSIKNGKFFISLEGVDIISPFTKNKVILNQKGEQLALYGRDIFLNLVEKYPKGLKPGEKCVLVNNKDESLGLGIAIMKKKFIENIKDRGLYLRKGE